MREPKSWRFFAVGLLRACPTSYSIQRFLVTTFCNHALGLRKWPLGLPWKKFEQIEMTFFHPNITKVVSIDSTGCGEWGPLFRSRNFAKLSEIHHFEIQGQKNRKTFFHPNRIKVASIDSTHYGECGPLLRFRNFWKLSELHHFENEGHWPSREGHWPSRRIDATHGVCNRLAWIWSGGPLAYGCQGPAIMVQNKSELTFSQGGPQWLAILGLKKWFLCLP